MKIISLLLFIIEIFCQELFAAIISPKDLVPAELLNEFLSTGTTNSKILDISKNKKFFVEVPGIISVEKISKEKYYQPFEIKEGCFLLTEYMINEQGEKQNFVSTLIQTILLKTGLHQCFLQSLYGRNSTISFPKFPIIFKSSEMESLSFSHLVYMWEVVSNQISISIKAASELDLNTSIISRMLAPYINAISDVPNFFQKCYDCGIFEHSIDRLEAATFVCEKEEFFSNIKSLIEMISDNIDENGFLNIIYDLDSKLNKVFFKIILKNYCLKI